MKDIIPYAFRSADLPTFLFTAINHSCPKSNYPKLPISSLQMQKAWTQTDASFDPTFSYCQTLTVDLKNILRSHFEQCCGNISFELTSAFSNCHCLHNSFFIYLHDLVDLMTEPGGKVALLGAPLVTLNKLQVWCL